MIDHDELLESLTATEIETCRKRAAAAILASSRQDLTGMANQVVNGRRDRHHRMQAEVKKMVRDKIAAAAKENA